MPPSPQPHVPPHAGGETEFLVRASYLEIYQEDIRDLLSKNPNAKLELKESVDKGVYVKDLMQFVVKGVPEINSVQMVRRPGGGGRASMDTGEAFMRWVPGWPCLPACVRACIQVGMTVCACVQVGKTVCVRACRLMDCVCADW